MSYSIVFLSEAEKDLAKMDRNVQVKVLKKIKKISVDPHIGHSLGNRAGIDLSGHYKAYVDNKKIRIVYRIIRKEIAVLIVAIGRRSELEVYRNAAKRIAE